MKISVNAPVLDLSGLSDASKQEVLAAMQAGLAVMANAAKRRVARGSKTGRIYRRRGIEHQASAPGEPPATDTGELIASISSDAVLEGDEVVGFLQATAPHAVHLELGTRRMAARPFMSPSVDENLQRLEGLIGAGLDRAQRDARR